MVNFNLQDFLAAMEERIVSRADVRFDAVDEQLKEIAELKTRVALLEQSNAVIRKGLWAVFITTIGGFSTYIVNLMKHGS